MPNSKSKESEIIQAGDFESEKHFYPRVLNASIHPLVHSFFQLGNERILARFSHLNPAVNVSELQKILAYQTNHFMWAGSDLFHVTTATGQRNMIIVETNSCPSGQKSMPLLSETDEFGGYKVVLESSFRRLLNQANLELGALAVVFDKNGMEAGGYAAVLAELCKEKVYLVEYHETEQDPNVKFENQIMYIRHQGGISLLNDLSLEWISIRACFKYVTQRPWRRFPLYSKTIVMNSIIACLAGGRNKMMAAKAYDFYNAELLDAGLSIKIPETIKNVTKSEIPIIFESMGGQIVIKVPYSNAGQGVYTITNEKALSNFMMEDHHYDKFIVQALVGNATWSSTTRHGKFYHVGTIPNKKNETYVSDLRVMIACDENGFKPVSIYARRARKPLLKNLTDDLEVTTWEMLGTNLSVRVDSTTWNTEAQRLLLMDRKDFNQLGLGIDDLIDAYVQTVLSVVAIDRLCDKLVPDGKFDFELFKALNPDDALIDEILI